MRILIADDEALVRFGLISVLRDILEDEPEFVEASNGVQLIEKSREFCPHIAFVDIRMPRLNGLEAIARAKESAPDSLWIILTGHADFNYAQTALKLGVEDFLLKPADPEEVRLLVSRLSQIIHERQILRNRELNAKVSAILGNTTATRYDAFFHRPQFWQACLIYWDSSLPDTQLVTIRHEFSAHVCEHLDSIDSFSATLTSLRDGTLLMVFAVPSREIFMDRLIEDWHRRISRIRTESQSITGRDIGTTWLLTHVVVDAETLFQEVLRLSEISALRYLSRPGEILEYSEILNLSRKPRLEKLAHKLEQAARAHQLGHEADFHGITHELKELSEKLNTKDVESAGPSWYGRLVLPFPGVSRISIGELIRRMHDEGHTLFAKKAVDDPGERTGHTLAKEALAIINQRYRETIGIAQVAEELGVTPNYLSTLFKRETGTSFTSTLTEKRLEKSRELLTVPGANVRSIAMSLGYQSSRHFSRLFKERYGTTPSQWAKCEISS